MAGNGPPPKDPSKRARRNATFPMTMLPSDGPSQSPPEWPLLPDASTAARLRMAESAAVRLRDQWASEEDSRKARTLARQLEAAEVQLAEVRQLADHQVELESSLWTELWATPQAAQWHLLRWTREVAQYVRWKVKAELGSLDASKEARQLADRLGLSPLSMLRLRWAVSPDEVGEKRQESQQQATKPGSRARRGPLTVVKDEPPKAVGDD
jgi:hypothetical protein